MRFLRHAALPALALAGCNGAGESVAANNAATAQGGQATRTQVVAPEPTQNLPFEVQEIARFSQPWAMAFIPDSPYALITERGGALKLWQPDGEVMDVAGVPAVQVGGQGGLGDVVLHPQFGTNNIVYLSYAEPGPNGTSGAAVGRARLNLEGDQPRLDGFQVIWRQHPKMEARLGHLGHRLAFSPDGQHLFITNGDRQSFDPAQDNSQHLGTIVRITPDGGTPSDNPFAGQGEVASQIWSYGHRNPLGLAFDTAGNLWSHEMGPRHGDEFNLILPGRNYGYPVVSWGDHYDGARIPNPDTRPEFEQAKIAWVPAISPAGMIVYRGDLFPQWRNSAFLGGLSGRVLVRVALQGTEARVADTWDMGQRIREVEEGPDGAIYVLEDERNNQGGRLLRLTPRG
ncbi:MAG: PQQ-dependent sugar dehydrogenase [Allosphingosinicella sp.]|uniref:PQQ-dependent sugar dehydrogenase n=1 Tax=Allosphingosinicella sp. TaxID=2823234 RepID=UPI00396234A1